MLIVDHTAIVGMFQGHRDLLALYRRADAGEFALHLPVGSMVDAAEQIDISAGEWAGFLWPPTVVPIHLSESCAVEIGNHDGALGARHALWELRQTDNWSLVTMDDHLYPTGTPVEVIK